MKDRTHLLVELHRWERQRDASPPYSPEWDAAMAAIEELRSRLALAPRISRPVPDPSTAGAG